MESIVDMPPKKIQMKELACTLFFLSNQMIWQNFTEIRELYIPHEFFKRGWIIQKDELEFEMLRQSRLFRQMCQHEKPPANEI